MISRRNALITAGAAGLIGMPRAARASYVPYSMNLAAITPPALPIELLEIEQPWQSATDGNGVNYLVPTNTGGGVFNGLSFPANKSGPSVVTATFQFNAVSLPSASAVNIITCWSPSGNSYLAQFSHDTGSSSGAVILKATGFPASYAQLGSSVGSSTTLFTAGVKYLATFTTSGSGTLTLDLSVQRLSDNLWLTSSGTWSATPQSAITTTDSSSPFLPYGGTQIYISNTATDGVLYGCTVNDAYPRATQYGGGATPALAVGGTYGGYHSTSLIAPRWIKDGSRYVTWLQIVSDTNGLCNGGFFSAPDLSGPWTYISGSFLTPQGGDVYIGTSGLMVYNGGYMFIYGHGANVDSQDTQNDVWFTTDPTFQAGNWSVLATNITNYPPNGGFCTSLVQNPTSGDLEIFYGNVAGRNIQLMTSTDGGVTWTQNGVQLAVPPHAGEWGQVSAWYEGTRRFLASDIRLAGTYIGTAMYWADSPYTNYVYAGNPSTPNTGITWQHAVAAQFDVKLLDTGDGLGLIRRALFIGQPSFNNENDGLGSLGYAWQALNSVSPSGGGRRL